MPINTDNLRAAEERLRAANQNFARTHPGERAERQPVHTVYGGAQLFKAESVRKIGDVALAALDEYAAAPEILAEVLDIEDEIAPTVHGRIREKLEREPVEDFRIDFEDGYGNRPDAEEDGHAQSTAREVARALANGTLSPFIGIRIKTLNEELRRRALRTLDLFMGELLDAAGKLPPGFVVTLPKITAPEQVQYFVDVLQELERAHGLAAESLRFEMMVETPQSIIGDDGTIALPGLVRLAGPRLSAAHFGTYDYTASCNITAAHQYMNHPACNFARQIMQASLAGTGIWISDGSTAVLPVAPFRGDALSAAQRAANEDAVYGAWQMHFEDVRTSLILGFYQGWDLHPAQLVTRYAAVFSFFLEGFEPAAARLSNFLEKAAQATLLGDVFDDAATGQGLLNYFIRAINSGAVQESEVILRTGLSADELRTRSFPQILKLRGSASKS